MSGEEREATSPIERGPAPSWSQRAEHRTSSGGRLTAQLLTPLLAVVPWLMMMGAIVLLARSMTSYRVTFERGWGEIVGGTVLLLVAAGLWAALTAWSSSGAAVAGLCTLAFGFFVVTEPGLRLVYRMGREGPASLQTAWYSVASELLLLPIGALLLAAGLGAAGARRWGRRRA